MPEKILITSPIDIFKLGRFIDTFSSKEEIYVDLKLNLFKEFDFMNLILETQRFENISNLKIEGLTSYSDSYQLF